MDSLLATRIALSFCIAGLWIALSTFASERLGSRIGGLVANLPSNILVSLLFMAVTRGTEYAVAAAASVPVGMAVDTVFLLVLIAVLPRGLGIALPAALAAWAISAAAAIGLPFTARLSTAPLTSIALYLAVTAACFAVAEFGMNIRAVPRRPAGPGPLTLVVRALFAGTVVACAVTIAQLAPARVAGILATFPAVLTSTMVILTRSQGTAFARATGKVLIVSSPNIVVYSTAVGLLFPLLGPWWGTAASFL